jgi:Na+-transporting NADH:ubiquinone oxidoreductase subunit B
MRALARLLERLRPLFEEGGKWAVLAPVYRAADAFLFAHEEETATAPFGRDAVDLKRYMSLVIVALLPCVAAAVYFFGLRVLAMIAVSYAVGGAVEVLFAVCRKEDINEGLLVTGLLFPLILPPGLPLWMVAVGVAFGVLVGKEVFGGTGRNLFNPAILGRCFLAIGYPRAMSGNWILPGSGPAGRCLQFVDASTVDAVTAATPLVHAKDGTFAPLADLFLGSVPGSAGETSALAILLGAAFLLLTRVASWRTMLGTIGSFLALATVLHALLPGSFGPPVWHLLAGSLLFGAVFMATDPVTGPVTHGGRWAYGAIIGCSTVLIRNLTGYVEGVMFAILLGNICAPSLDEVVCRIHARRVRRETR